MARAPRKPKKKPAGGDDADLWQRVVQTITPLPSTTERLRDVARRQAEAASAAAAAALPAAPPPRPVAKSREKKPGQPRPVAVPIRMPTALPRQTYGLEDTQAAVARGRVAGLDRRTAERLRKGVMQIDARLDLHGMNREQAHAALRQQVRGCHAAGKRCLLVITGKGNRGAATPDSPYTNPEPPGRLKREVPGWLSSADLGPMVLSTSPAVPRDGGGGALYVLLRRRRDDKA